MRSIQDSPIAQLLIQRNKEQSAEFVRTEPERELYRARHKTDVIIPECMDGRISFSRMTETPVGTCQSFRNLGGRFDLGWPFFNSLIQRATQQSIKTGRTCLIPSTYHWSRSSRELGCRGFDLDTDAAISYIRRFKKDLDFVFEGSSVIYPVMMGIETDLDALLVYGDDGSTLDLAAVPGITPDDLRAKVERMFPRMAEEMLNDLLNLLEGNLRHIDKVRRSNRTLIQLDHTECVLGYGRGMDWIRMPNMALITGPFGFEQDEALYKAAGIIMKNLKERRVDAVPGFVLLISAIYETHPANDRKFTILKVHAEARYALKVLEQHRPDFLEHAALMKCIVSKETRALELID